MEVQLKWKNKLYPIKLSADAKIYQLKLEIEKITGLKPNEQKITGFGKTIPKDEAMVCSFTLKPKHTIMVIKSMEQEAKRETEMLKQAENNVSAQPIQSNNLPNNPPTSAIEKLNQIKSQVDELQVKIEVLVNTTDKPSDFNYLLKKYDEDLTKKLLELDSLSLDNNQNASMNISEFREKRKEQVLKIQLIHEQLDNLKKH